MAVVFSPHFLLLQSSLHSPSKIASSTLTNFQFHFSPPYWFIKPSLQSYQCSFPFPLYLKSFFTSLFLHTAILTTPLKILSPNSTTQPIQAASKQVCFVSTDTALISSCFLKTWLNTLYH